MREPRFAMLPLAEVSGYVWINPDKVRLIRCEFNDPARAEYHFVQMDDGLEYKIFGTPFQTITVLQLEGRV